MIDDTVDGSSVKVQRNVIDTALQEIKYNDEAAKELVKTISERNVHKITDNTSITFDASDGLFKTPLGIVKREGVEKAIELLGEIEKFIPSFTDMRSKEPDAVIIKELPVRGGTKRKSDGTQVVHDAPKKLPPSIPLAMIVSEIMSLNEQYFVIIPNKVKNARDIEGLLFSQKAVDEQRTTCDALLDTLNLIDDLKEKKLKEEDKDKTNPEEGGDKPSTFSVEIETIEDKDTFKRISDFDGFFMLLGDGEVDDVVYKHVKANSLLVKQDESHKVEKLAVGKEEAAGAKCSVIEVYMGDQSEMKFGNDKISLKDISQEGWVIANITVSVGFAPQKKGREGANSVSIIAERVDIICTSFHGTEIVHETVRRPMKRESSDDTRDIEEKKFIDVVAFREELREEKLHSREYYDNVEGNENIDNEKLKYGLVSLKESGEKFVVRLDNEFDSGKHDLCGINNTEGSHRDLHGVNHYAVVLTFISKDQSAGTCDTESIAELQKVVEAYVKKIGLDVRGLWAIFDYWNNNHGLADVEYCYDPMAWRVYASRNEAMKKGLPYAFQDEYLITDIVGYQYKNHCLICYEHLGEEIQDLRDMINTPVGDLEEVMESMNFSLKHQLALDFKLRIHNFREEKIKWVESHEDERLSSYPGEVAESLMLKEFAEFQL
ncbi:hypothetical protein EV174_001038 [Coemansia sp. RSA 2320]|nr:hypothetical protein EV174_001038 [Coemansia sp. RSA 2320]